MTRIFLLLLCFLFIQASFSQQLYIRGQVIDDETGLPLKDASVYINNTTRGTITDEKGNFELGPFDPGRYEVVASYVGYDAVLYTAEITTTSFRISFKLNKKGTMLREVLVLTKETRERYLDIFKKNVLGISNIADKCQIKNIDEVQFASGENKDEIVAFTEKELEIENPELGYTIYFELMDFYFNKTTSMNYFYGYTRYIDWSKNEQAKKKWLRNRRQVYEGSTLHFFRSLVDRDLDKQGFTVYQSQKRRPLMITNQPIQKKPSVVLEDSIISLYADSSYRIYELKLDEDGLSIYYSKNTELKNQITKKKMLWDQPQRGSVSGLRLKKAPVLISEKGAVLTPLAIIYDGIWAFELLANMLPADYVDQ